MSDQPSYPVSRLDYDLPQELIAQAPLPERTASRLLHVRVTDNDCSNRSFSDLPDLLPGGSTIYLNNSRVIPARLYGTRKVNERGQGGGRVEVLFHRWLGDGVCEAVVGSGSKLDEGERIDLPEGWQCELLEPKRLDGIKVSYIRPCGRVARVHELLNYLNFNGITPLPPYIKRDPPAPEIDAATVEADKRRYQTVFARTDGSVAAPTAGLHFDESMLDRLKSDRHAIDNVTLHVGLGTFAPVRAGDLRDHAMHEEVYSLPRQVAGDYFKRLGNTPVVAVGTTSLRVLHTLWQAGPQILDHHQPEIAGATRAFIYPGHGTEACDLLLTNFHLPRSTLLALVYAFGGEDLMRRVYAHAITERYRFFSYGDCMLIDRTA